MIITIEGKRSEGKTFLAKKICKGKKVSFITEHSLKSPFWTDQMDDDTELIVIDDVKNFKKTYKIFRSEFLKVNKPCEEPFNINTPDVILIKFSN